MLANSFDVCVRLLLEMYSTLISFDDVPSRYITTHIFMRSPRLQSRLSIFYTGSLSKLLLPSANAPAIRWSHTTFLPTCTSNSDNGFECWASQRTLHSLLCSTYSTDREDHVIKASVHLLQLGYLFKLCMIRGFHGDDYEEYRLLGCYAVWLL
jgi:hypothetical protein